jgi:hypothetical protein
MLTEQQALEELEKDTVDTSSWMVDDPRAAKIAMQRAESKIYSLAVPQADGTLRGWHVTDDPEKVVELLRTKGDFYAREGDLCGGLYVSAVPHYWEGRSSKKWDFLPKLSKEARGILYNAVQERLDEKASTGYITKSEYDRASDDIAMAKEKDFWQILDIVANQPFNVDIIGLSERLGLAIAFKPPHVPVDFVGRYLEFNTQRAIDANEFLLELRYGSLEGLSRLDLCNMLKEYGWDGVYTKAGMGTNPELVIWNGDKIVAFGDYAAEGGAELSGKEPEDIWLTDPEKRARFEAKVNADKQVSTLFDRKVGNFSFDDLMIPDIKDLQTVVEDMIEGRRDFRIGRFKELAIFNTDRIMDIKSSKKDSFMGLSEADLQNLRELLAKAMAVMSP